MNKRRLYIIILAIVIALGPLAENGAEAGRGNVVKGSSRMPTIDLKDTELRGTAVSGIFQPIAIVELTDIDQTCWYRVGDTLRGRRIVKIERGAVILDENGKRYVFGLPQGSLGPSLKEGRGDDAVMLGRKIGNNTWKVNLDTAINMLTRITDIMKEARIKPYFAIGRAAGVRIDRIKDGSVITQMGLQDGDIIKGVNGFGLMTPTRVFEAYRRYKNDRLIQLQLIRDDEPVTLTYNIVK